MKSEARFIPDEAPCDDCKNQSFCRVTKTACSDFRIYVFENILLRPGDKITVGFGKTKRLVESCRMPLRKHYRKVFEEKDR